jgi:chromosome segregation ATPase
VIEPAMFFALGFLIAGLAALLVLPAFWRRALRLSARRARMQTPLSEAEIIAERDQLRAAHAIESRKIERRLEGMHSVVAGHLAELGRRATQIFGLERETELQREQLLENARDLAARRAEIVAFEGELGTSRVALHDFATQLETARATVDRLQEQRMAMETEADRRRALIASLETRASGLEMNLEDHTTKARDEARAASAERERLASKLSALADQAARNEAALVAATAESVRLSEEFARTSARLETTQKELERMRESLAASERQREEALLEGRRQLEVAAARDNELANLRANRTVEPVTVARHDAELRDAIARIGEQFLRLTAEAEQRGSLAPDLAAMADSEFAPANDRGVSLGHAISSQLRQLQSLAPPR